MFSLQVGHTYYQLTFADSDKTMPGVEPLVYLGDADQSDGEVPHIFQDTVSYVRFGSRLKLAQDHDEITIYFVSPKDIGLGIVDVHQVATEVFAAAKRAAALNDPVLSVLREG
jgi:hypothetical protein